MPTHETEGTGRGLSEAEADELDAILVALWQAETEVGYHFSAARVRAAVERIVAEHVDTALAEVAHWKRVAGHVRDQAEAQQERAEQAEAERDRMRAQVAACEALAEEWERLAADAAWAAGYRAAWGSSAGQVRAALGDPDAVLVQVRAAAWDEGFTACAQEFSRQRREPDHPITRTNPYRRAGSDGGVELTALAKAWDEGAAAEAENQARLIWDDGDRIANPYRGGDNG